MKKRLIYVLVSVITFFIGFSLVYVLEDLFSQATESRKDNIVQPINRNGNKLFCEVHGKEMIGKLVEVWEWERPGTIAFSLTTVAHKGLFSYCDDFKLSYKKTRKVLFPHSGSPIPLWYFDSNPSKYFDVTSNKGSCCKKVDPYKIKKKTQDD